MLSILIPVYNFDSSRLVKDLHNQALKINIEFEILVYDDGSTQDIKQQNRKIQTSPQIRYLEFPNNIGRSKIRNRLAADAHFPFLLFMDCDSKVRSNNYLKKYIATSAVNTVIYGGRKYNSNPPSDTELNLHYYFGKNREAISAIKRKKNPHLSFMTNNFLIPKAIFDSIRFEESIEGYGHEDTLFGLDLKEKGIPVIHIDNPLEHIGLEHNSVFLKKQKEAVRNLYKIWKKEPFLETRLLSTFINCKKWKIDSFLNVLLRYFKPLILKQLDKKKPNLFFLDLLKLQFLLEMDEA